MNFLLTWIHWGLAALLYLQSAELPKGQAVAVSSASRVCEIIKFLEVYERSFCRTIETLVDIFQEYPDEVEYIFKPSCVPLMRCAGCCGDEGLECVPVDVYNVTMELLPKSQRQLVNFSEWSQYLGSICLSVWQIHVEEAKPHELGVARVILMEFTIQDENKALSLLFLMAVQDDEDREPILRRPALSPYDLENIYKSSNRKD
ncbi:Vascular endothelial growth factor A [Pitangus sulphuratus]|nr:Vascular endothelial growth factor A [Pitangus sulphuratus]